MKLFSLLPIHIVKVNYEKMGNQNEIHKLKLADKI